MTRDKIALLVMTPHCSGFPRGKPRQTWADKPKGEKRKDGNANFSRAVAIATSMEMAERAQRDRKCAKRGFRLIRHEAIYQKGQTEILSSFLEGFFLWP